MKRERVQPSRISSWRRDLANLAGDFGPGRFVLGALGGVMSGVGEPVGWGIDVANLGYLSLTWGNYSDYWWASDLGASYAQAEEHGVSLDEQAAANSAAILLNTATLGLYSAPDAIEQLVSADTAPEDRGAAAAQLAFAYLGLRGALRSQQLTTSSRPVTSAATAAETRAVLTPEPPAAPPPPAGGGGAGKTGRAEFYGTETGQTVPVRTPAGRPITAHAAERMGEPPRGRRVSTPEEADILAETGAFKKMEIGFPEANPNDISGWRASVTLERGDLPGKPSVVVSLDWQERIVSVIISA
jgi:hypothetical protein